MKINKAVITAAGTNQRTLPLQTVVDTDGVTKSALRIVIEEAASAGIDEICIVIHPGDRQAYLAAAGDIGIKLTLVEQESARGYGHALYCARDFAGNEPFLHMVSDHLYVSRSARRCAQQLVEIATAEQCSVSAVQPTRESMLPYYGAVGGHRVPNRPSLYTVENVMEKPTPTEAEQHLIVPGLRAGHYLCFFGMHVLTPAVMSILGELIAADQAGRGPQLSAALARLAGREHYVAFEIAGGRFNIGLKYGLLVAQLAIAMEGRDRDEVLSQLLDLMARRALGAH